MSELANAIKTNDYVEFKKEFSKCLEQAVARAAEELRQEPIQIGENKINEEVEDEEDEEASVVQQIATEAEAIGVTDISYMNGVFSGSVHDKASLVTFLELLDNQESIEGYHVDILDDSGEDGEVVDLETFEDDGEPAEFIVYAYLVPELVSYVDDSEGLEEAMIKWKMNFRGMKRMKMKCGKGFKWNNATRHCEKMSGQQLMTLRKSARQAVRTKKAEGVTLKRRTVRKMKKAKRFRKLMGLDRR